MRQQTCSIVHDWSSDSTIFSYQCVLDDALSRVPLLHPFLTDVACGNNNRRVIDCYYNDAMQCIVSSCASCIPCKYDIDAV